jgi:hypothetical protein
MLVRIVLIAALIGTGLFVAKEEHVFERAGIVGHCQAVQPPRGSDGAWYACYEGVMTGYPNLVGDSCDRSGRRPKIEYWRCPAGLNQGVSG